MGGKVRSIYGLVAAAVAATAPAGGQSVQYRSVAGVEYRAQRDTGAIARAECGRAGDPRSVERIIQVGIAQSGARQFREAIQTFTRGLTIVPTDAMLYRWRGHRYLSVREFDRALDDLTRGSRLDSTNYGIWYHLGIVRYARGDFAGAADALARAQGRPADAAELAGATDWLWMSLSRAGRAAEARAMLDRRPDSLAAANAYAQRLRLYRGEIGPDDVITAADTGDIAVATLSYGVGNWDLVRGDTAQARAWFERSVRSGGWPAFGFIMSEVELRRRRGRKAASRQPPPLLCGRPPRGAPPGRAAGSATTRGGRPASPGPGIAPRMAERRGPGSGCRSGLAASGRRGAWARSHPPRNEGTHGAASPRIPRPGRVRHGARLHGHVGLLRRARWRRGPPPHSSGARARRHPSPYPPHFPAPPPTAHPGAGPPPPAPPPR